MLARERCGYVKRVDAVLPGKHTRQLYDRLLWKEASALGQIRTGMARLNGYFYRINAAEKDRCACEQAKKTVEHFLFRCRKWTAHRIKVLQYPTSTQETYPSWEGNRLPMIRSGHQLTKEITNRRGSAATLLAGNDI